MIRPRQEVLDTSVAIHGGRRALADGGNMVRHDFSVCLNAFGPADIVRRAIVDAPVDEYPDPESRAAREAASVRWNVPVSQVAFGAGAAEFIHTVCAAYLDHDDIALIVVPAFGEYDRAVRLRGAHPVSVWYDGADVAEICAEIEQRHPRLVFLCTPTTPTGLGVPLSDLGVLADACRSIGSLLVLDQAYDAFTAHPLGTPAFPGHEAVLHLRSLTKEHALAGVRAAFAVGPVPVMNAIERVRVPWSASSAAQAAAVAAMTDGATDHVTRTTTLLRGEAARLREECVRLGYASSPSIAHYFTLRVGDASRIQSHLLAHAEIAVRDCTSFGLADQIRVAARTPAENDMLLLALRDLYA